MRNIRYIIFFLIIVLVNDIIYSQDIKSDSSMVVPTLNMFREPSYFFLGSGLGNMESLMFEGDIVPYYMLSLNRNIRWGVQLSPRIIVRMYNIHSHPVRNPSFMPTITFFYHLKYNVNKNRDLFTYCSWYHHSNGQDGNFYNADSVSVNTKNGSFYSNWLEGGMFLSRLDPNLTSASNFIKLSLAYSYMQNAELKGIYGRLRFFLDFQNTITLSKIPKILRSSDNNHNVIINQSIHFGWIGDKLYNTEIIDKKRLIFRYTFSFKPSFFKDVNLFCQYYYGQDYYNISFGKTLSVFRFGLSSKIKLFN